MSQGLFAYPPKASVGQLVPKTRIYDGARPTTAVRNLFVTQVERVTWQYKLFPGSTNLPARAGVEEILVFALTLKTPDLNQDVLRCIDKSTPHPIFFELTCEGRVKVAAAYKRPSEADAARWVVDGYFESRWQPARAAREPLPLALDLAGLYEQMLRTLIPLAARPGEALREQVERAARVATLQAEVRKLETRVRREKQFNRKVELNAQLREARAALEALTA